MENADLEGMTLEELDEEFRRLAVLLVPIENRRAAIVKIRDARKRHVTLHERVDGLPPIEEDALRAVLNERAEKKK